MRQDVFGQFVEHFPLRPIPRQTMQSHSPATPSSNASVSVHGKKPQAVAPAKLSVNPLKLKS